MQQKQKEQYESALGSIFDFIFEQTKQPLSKVKPIKPTGVDGASELVDAVGSVLANPLLFVNEEAMKAFKDGMDLAPVQLRVGDRPTDLLKIKLSDIGSILEDPGEWADKQFKKLEMLRKQQRAAWAGEELKGVLGGLWARNLGLETEAQMAMAGAARKGPRQTGASYEYMSARTRELGSKYLEDLKADSLRQELVTRYGETIGKEKYYEKIEKNSIERFGGVRGTKISEAFKEWDKNPDEAVLDERVYYTLESQYLKGRAEESFREGEEDKAEEYNKASAYVLNSYDDRLKKEYLNDQKKQLREYSKLMDSLKNSSDPDKDRKIKELKKSRNIIASQINQSRLEAMAGSLGTVEGWYHSVKNMYTGGNLLPNIITGNFFDNKYNKISWLQPAKKVEKGFRGVDFLRAKHFPKKKDGTKELWKVLQERYAEGMMPLYYLSPVTWARSLTNGEVFAYIGHLGRESLKKRDLIKGIEGFDVKIFLTGLDKRDSSYLDGFIGKFTDDQMKKLKGFARRDKFWGDVAYVFSTPSRIKGALEELIQKEIFAKIRDKVGKAILKTMTDTVARELIQSWITRGGIGVLIKGLLTSAAAALGIVATPVTSIIIGAITWVITGIIQKVGKVIFKFSVIVGKGVMYGLIGLALITASIMFSFLGVFGKHSHVSPHEVIVCEEYANSGFSLGGGTVPGTGPGSPGGQVLCESGDTVDDLLQKNIQALSSRRDLSGVGLVLIDCPGHSACSLIGTAWCHASGIYCKRDKIEGAMARDCNYVSNLLCHELVHHIQALRQSSLTREWGADYVCSNGGGYSFRDSSGECKVATAISLPSVCSGQIAVEAAYHNTSYPGVQSCLDALEGEISFCN